MASSGDDCFAVQIGASTFSTNVGAPMFLGMAGTAAANGLAIAMFEWHVSDFVWRTQLSQCYD